MRSSQKKLLDKAQQYSGGSAIKTSEGYVFSGKYNSRSPQEQFKHQVQEEIDQQLKSGPVRTVEDRIGTAEPMSELELKRMKVILKIKKNPTLKSNEFLKSCLNQKRPLTEAQCDKALKTIGIMNSILKGKIERGEQ